MTTVHHHLFGTRSLNGKVEIFGEDVTQGNMFQTMFQTQGRQMDAEDGTVEWDELTFGRGLAPVVGYSGEHPNKSTLTKAARSSAVASTKRSVDLEPTKMFFERAPGELRPNARAYVEQEMKDLVQEISNTIEYMCAETLRGTLTVNSTNIPGTTQPFTLTYSPNTYTKSAGWGTAGTKILSSEIPALKTDFEQTSGLSPAQVISGNTVEGFIYLNTETTGFIGDLLGQRFIEAAGTLSGRLFNGLRIGGLDWIVNEKGYERPAGTFVRYLPTTDQAIVLPSNDKLSGVLGWALGRGLVPKRELGPVGSATDMIEVAQQGWYSYARLVGNVPTVKLFVGHVGLPILIRPDAISVADLN